MRQRKLKDFDGFSLVESVIVAIMLAPAIVVAGLLMRVRRKR
jgi:type II secretory pathway pseudopilin PulG